MKRLFDVIFSIFGLLVISPAFLLIIILTRIFIGKPVFFVQQRSGLYGKPFNILKFRTMENIYDEKGVLLPGKNRLTKFGIILRKLSLDEIPQLLNVLKGDMSIVGPRPLLIQYLDTYTKEQFRRHEVKPGITGWAQINGRNALSWKDKFELDLWYVDNHSINVDLKILWLTLKMFLKGDGINPPGQDLPPRFDGIN